MFETVKAFTYLVKTFFASRKLKRRAKGKSEEEIWQESFEFLRFRCNEFFKVCGAKVVFHGLERLPEKPGYLLVGNHQSDLDVLALISVMESPTAFVSKKELDHVPLIGNMLRLIGCVSIDRKDLRQSMEAIKTASERIQKGLNMVIFPEGTRSKGPQMGEFKKGSLHAAFDAKAAIVPFRIENMYAIFEGNKGIRIKPATAHIYFGDAIETKEMDRKAQRALGDQIKEIISNIS